MVLAATVLDGSVLLDFFDETFTGFISGSF